MDMIGNVWEWVDSVHSSLLKDPEPKKNKTKTLRIAKGGSWASQHQLATISYRNAADGEMKNPTFGFSLCEDCRVRGIVQRGTEKYGYPIS